MIGIFDSGLGGLTAVKALEKLMPKCDITYFGDTARIPYGSKGRDTITQYAFQDCRFLLTKSVNAILVACGTVSSNSLEALKERFTLPIIGVVDSAAKKACEIASGGNGVVAVLGTSATVKSGAFEKKIREYDKSLKIISIPCPLFVPLVENGRTSPFDKVTELVATEYISELLPCNPSAVILGCTHYPLLTPILSRLLPGSRLVSTADEACKSLCEIIEKSNINAGNSGKRDFFVSDDPVSFAENGKAFLGSDISSNVSLINIEEY